MEVTSFNKQWKIDGGMEKRKSNIMVFKDFSENKYYKNSDDNLFKVIETVHIFNKIEERIILMKICQEVINFSQLTWSLNQSEKEFFLSLKIIESRK